MPGKIFKKKFQKKLLTGISLAMIITGVYLGYKGLTKENNTTRYVTAAVEKGTLIISVSGNGQVSASNQIDIKPKTSGEVVYVGVKNGQEVKAGALLVQIDSRSAQKTVQNAKTALETARLELEEMLQPVDGYSLMQAENSLTQAKDNLTKLKFTQKTNYQNALDLKQKAEDNLEKAHEDAFNAITNAFLDLPALMTGLRDIMYGYELGDKYSWNIGILQGTIASTDYEQWYELKKLIDNAVNAYETARTRYDENFKNYKNISRHSEKELIEALLDESLATVKIIAEAVKSENTMLDYWLAYRSDRSLPVFNKVVEYQSNLRNYNSKASSHLSILLSAQKNLRDSEQAILNAERSLSELEQNQPLDLAAAERNVKEKEESLIRLKNGPDDLSLRAKKIIISQKEDALLDAQEGLANCYIRAPFDGIIANITAKKGELISSGAVVTMITKQKIAEVALNEIDAAKVKVGQRATLSFDALSELTITGNVIEVDTIGNVTAGVVSYGVKIALDIDDEKIKPSMSVMADIIIEAKTDVLVLPNNAIKFQAGTYYVELVEVPEETKEQFLASQTGVVLATPPKTQAVEVGLSGDLSIEIISGLKEGDVVVSSTIGPGTVQTTQTQRTQQFQIPGMGTQMRVR